MGGSDTFSRVENHFFLSLGRSSFSNEALGKTHHCLIDISYLAVYKRLKHNYHKIAFIITSMACDDFSRLTSCWESQFLYISNVTHQMQMYLHIVAAIEFKVFRIVSRRWGAKTLPWPIQKSISSFFCSLRISMQYCFNFHECYTLSKVAAAKDVAVVDWWYQLFLLLVIPIYAHSLCTDRQATNRWRQ